MSARVKSRRRNVLASTAVSSATTSPFQLDWLGLGVRLWITITGVVATGTTDELFLCGQSPEGVTVPIVGFSGANMLATAGTFCADFYPGAWLPATIASGGKLLGAAGIAVPLNWAVELIPGAGNSATIVIDAEMLP